MRQVRMIRLITVSAVLASVGCTSYVSKPPISSNSVAATQQPIHSFSYEIDSPLKNSRLAENAYEATKRIIPKAKESSSSALASSYPALQIKITERPFGGACSQEYLTGLSLGLIPSWCTRHGLYTYAFKLNNQHGLCRQKTYSINSTSAGHILLLPAAFMDTGQQPLDIYQAALKDFLSQDVCETP